MIPIINGCAAFYLTRQPGDQRYLYNDTGIIGNIILILILTIYKLIFPGVPQGWHKFTVMQEEKSDTDGSMANNQVAIMTRAGYI